MPKSYPKISIISPSLNQSQFIARTITSVLSQGYPNFEYIVIDGGSSDSTLEILKSYSDRIIWISEKDNGQAQAINKGIRKASGEIVSYLNSDDVLLPDSLFTVAAFFEAHPEADWVTGRCRNLDAEGREIRRLITYYKNLLLKIKGFNLLIMTNFISQPATFWRTSLTRQVGLFDEDLHYSIDLDYWLRSWKLSPLYVLDDYLAGFRIHKQSKTTSLGHHNIYVEEERKVVRKYSRSGVFLVAHEIHRSLMSLIYSFLNN
jgi:glycosyltransferase involved in cell wall biosynthesis